MQKPITPPAFLPCFYRVSVKAVIVHDGRLLLVRESSKRWDLPGGGVEHHENLHTALGRELEEELKLGNPNIQQDSLDAWFTYDRDPGWEKPVLNLIVRVTIPPEVNGADIIPGDGVEYSLFTKEELETLPLEKNIEEFRTGLMRKAFGDNKAV